MKRRLVVANFAEEFAEFYSRASNLALEERLMDDEQAVTERALLWTDADEVLAVLPVSISQSHLNWLRSLLKRSITVVQPKALSYSLSKDIINDSELLASIKVWCERGTTPLLIPYAATDQLATLVELLQSLQVNLDLSHLPTSNFWPLRRRLGSKVGFRQLCEQLPVSRSKVELPAAWICEDLNDAAAAVRSFLRGGSGAIVKPSDGSAGIGTVVIYPEQNLSLREIGELLANESFLRNTVVVVEELVLFQDKHIVSPSIELFVPPAEMGEPRVTYWSDQVITRTGEFLGVRIGPQNFEERNRFDAERFALSVGGELQRLGYRGVFDIDFATRSDGRLVPLEANLRRTGGTHAHELCERLYGHAYWNSRFIMSRDALPIRPIPGWDTVRNTIADLLLSYETPSRGVVPSMVGLVSQGYLGLVVSGRDEHDALHLQQSASSRLGLSEG